MKPLMFVPPAQAEALYDTQDDLRDDLRLDDRLTRLPWRDDESSEDLFNYGIALPIVKEALSRRFHELSGDAWQEGKMPSSGLAL